MFGNSHFERVHALFADQFEPDGADFLYRKSMKGAPVRVRAAERDAFIADFRRAYRYAFWAVMAGTILVIVLLALFVPDPDSAEGKIGMFGALGLVVAAFLAMHYWFWAAPARALERRPVLGQPRSRDEMRKLALARLSYGQLAAAAGIALVMLWNASAGDGLHGWDVFWLIFAGVMVAGAAFQAFRKWRSER